MFVHIATLAVEQADLARICPQRPRHRRNGVTYVIIQRAPEKGQSARHSRAMLISVKT
jgi:hypothetical protein